MANKQTSGADIAAEAAALPVDSFAAAYDRGQAAAVHGSIVAPDGSTVIFASKDMEAVTFPPLDKPLPAYVTAAETVNEPASFIDYITAYKSATAICRASLGQNRIVCVLDYHGRAREAENAAAVPNHAAHQITLLCPFDPDYAKWRKIFGTKLDQGELAEFIEDMVYTIGDPPAADLLEAIADLKIDRAVRFKSGRNARNGTIQFTYEEVDDDKVTGAVTLPDHLQIIVPIFQGGNPQAIDVRLRYVMDKGQVAFTLSVAGLEAKEREAFRSIGEKVRADTATPVFYTA